MVSQGSYCDFDGIPAYMQDTHDADGILEVESRREVDDFPILVGCGSSHGIADLQGVEDDVNKMSFVNNGSTGGEQYTFLWDMNVSFTHLESETLVGEAHLKGLDGGHTRVSVLGGIPICVSNEGASSGEEDGFCEDVRDALERDTVNRVAKMAFAANRVEREELISLRKKMIQVQSYLMKNGLSMAECEKL